MTAKKIQRLEKIWAWVKYQEEVAQRGRLGAIALGKNCDHLTADKTSAITGPAGNKQCVICKKVWNQ